MSMSYDEMMRMLREINEKKVPPKVDLPDFMKDLMNGKFNGSGERSNG